MKLGGSGGETQEDLLGEERGVEMIEIWYAHKKLSKKLKFLPRHSSVCLYTQHL